MGQCCGGMKGGKPGAKSRDSMYENSTLKTHSKMVAAYSVHGYNGGSPKENQDRGCFVQNFAGNPAQTMLLVCDGHGPAGAEASEGIVTTFLGRVAQDPVLHDCRASGKDAIAKQLEEIIYESETQVFIQKTEGAKSGTTFTMVIICGDDLAFTANVGDSRSAIALQENLGKFVAHDLTEDHAAATSPRERQRIKNAGGRLSKMGGNFRVMSPGGECALAPTRSVGDLAFDRAVVISKPEVTEVKLTPEHRYLVTASDGLWEFMDGQMVIDYLSRSQDISSASLELVKLAQSDWFRNCGGYCDDISLVCCTLPLSSWMGTEGSTSEQADAPSGGAPVQAPIKTEASTAQTVIRCHKLAGLQ